jgi:hypothetical protein
MLGSGDMGKKVYLIPLFFSGQCLVLVRHARYRKLRIREMGWRIRESGSIKMGNSPIYAACADYTITGSLN